MKFCSECKRELVRNRFEANANWLKRKTCGSECGRRRENRKKRERREYERLKTMIAEAGI